MAAAFCKNCKKSFNLSLCPICDMPTISNEDYLPDEGGVMPQMSGKKTVDTEEYKPAPREVWEPKVVDTAKQLREHFNKTRLGVTNGNN